MSRRSLKRLPALLLLAYAQCVSADSDPNARAATKVSDKGLDQIVYKGLVGNVLDEIPMDPSKRVSLQRTNAILSNTWSGHTLSTLAGLSNPVLLIGGLVWGVWAASNIKPEDEAKTASVTGAAPAAPHLVAMLEGPATGNTARGIQPDAAPTNYGAPTQADEPIRIRAPVMKVWLPQRSINSAGQK